MPHHMTALESVKGKWMHLSAFIALPSDAHRAQFIAEADDQFMQMLALLTHDALKAKMVPEKHKKLANAIVKCNTPKEAKILMLKDHQAGGGWWDTLKHIGKKALGVVGTVVKHAAPLINIAKPFVTGALTNLVSKIPVLGSLAAPLVGNLIDAGISKLPGQEQQEEVDQTQEGGDFWGDIGDYFS